MTLHSNSTQFVVVLIVLLCQSTPAAAAAANPRDIHIAPLLHWAQQNHIPSPTPPLDHNPSHGLHLRTTTTIQANDIVVRCPRALIWTTLDSPKIDPVQFAVDQQSLQYQTYLRANGQCLMAVRLLHERQLGTSSQWYPYISALPNQTRLAVHIHKDLLAIANNQVFFSNQRKSATVLRAVHQVLSLPNGVYSKMNPPLQSVSFQDFLNAWSVVASRSFQVDGSPTLVPIADFANHNNEACDVAAADKKKSPENSERDPRQIVGSAYGGNTLESDFVLRATRAYTVGEAIMICYHNHASNSMLLTNWGFTLPNNKRDYIMLQAAEDCNGSNGSSEQRGASQLKCLIIHKLKWTNTCLFSDALSLTKHWMVSNCSRTIGLGNLSFAVLHNAWNTISAACEDVGSKKCNLEQLSQELSQVIDSRVKTTHIVSTLIGKLLHAEQEYSTDPPSEYAQRAMAHARSPAAAAAAVAAVQTEEDVDVLHLLNIRHGILHVIEKALVEQVIRFATAQGVVPGAEVDTEHLLNLLRVTFGNSAESKNKEQMQEEQEDGGRRRHVDL